MPPDLARHLKAAQADMDGQNYHDATKELRAAIAIEPKLPGVYYQLGFALYRLQEFKEAAAAFSQELNFQPPDAYSLYYLGRIAADAGQTRQAVTYYRQSIDAADVLDCRDRLGGLLLSHGSVEEAVSFLQDSVRVRPEDGSLHYLLARGYKAKGRVADAKSEFDAAARWKTKFSHDMTALFDLRNELVHRNADAARATAGKLIQSNDSDILMASATVLGQAGEHREAAEFLNRVISMNSAIPEAYYNLARAYIALENRSAAKPELAKAIELKPDFYEAQLVLGTLLVDENNGDAAIPHLRQAAGLRSDNPKLMMMLGLQYYQRGYFADAIGVLKPALDLMPNSPDPRYLLIEAYYRNFEYEHALHLAEETAAKFQDQPMSHIQYGAQLNNMGKLPEAKDQLEIALAREPNSPEAQALFGDVLFKMGRPEESLAHFQAALSGDPKLMDAQAGLGKALIQLKRYAEAAQAMESAVQIDPSLSSLHLYLSQAYRGLSRPDEAKREAALFSKLNQERAAARDKEGDRKYPN